MDRLSEIAANAESAPIVLRRGLRKHDPWLRSSELEIRDVWLDRQIARAWTSERLHGARSSSTIRRRRRSASLACAMPIADRVCVELEDTARRKECLGYDPCFAERLYPCSVAQLPDHRVAERALPTSACLRRARRELQSRSVPQDTAIWAHASKSAHLKVVQGQPDPCFQADLLRDSR